MDFLDPKNDCGQNMLKIAAAGSSILAELLRLSNHIPDVFLFSSRSKQGLDMDEEEKAKEIAKPEKPSKKDKKNAAAAHNEKAQKLLEDQLREDTLRLQHYEQRKYEQILFDMTYLLD